MAATAQNIRRLIRFLEPSALLCKLALCRHRSVGRTRRLTARTLVFQQPRSFAGLAPDVETLNGLGRT